MRTAPARLGELLEKRGQVTREQLLRALRNQKVLGGRLGTCLLEIEALTEEQLCSALAAQHGVPCATPEDLRGIPDDVLAMLPAKVARRCHAIAFQATTTQVKVALLDARNLTLQDEISFVVGKRIRWHVASELRLTEALEKHYGEECPARLAKLLDKMNRSRFLWARESAAAKTPDGAAHPAGDQLQWDSSIAGISSGEPRAGEAAADPSPESVELPHFQHQALDLPTVAAPTVAATAPVATPAAAAPAPPAAPPPKPPAARPTTKKAPASSPAAPRRRSVEETEQRLVQPEGRDDVARALLDFAAGLVARAVLFVVRKEEAAAWFWSGDGIDEARLKAVRLSVKPPSLFAGLQEEGAQFRGPLRTWPRTRRSPQPLHCRRLARAPGPAGGRQGSAGRRALLEPPWPRAPSSRRPTLADLQRLTAKAAIAFELCIMRSKLSAPDRHAALTGPTVSYALERSTRSDDQGRHRR